MPPNGQHQDFIATFLDSQLHSKCQVGHLPLSILNVQEVLDMDGQQRH